MDYQIPIKIKDDDGCIWNCALRTECDDDYASFVSNKREFDGNYPQLPKTKEGYIYSWNLRDYRRSRDWRNVFKGRKKEIKEKLRKSKTLYEFFTFFGFEWPEDEDENLKIIHCDNNCVFKKISI